MPRNSLGSNRYEKKKKRNNNRPIPYGIFSSTVWDGEREEKDFNAKIWPKVRKKKSEGRTCLEREASGPNFLLSESLSVREKRLGRCFVYSQRGRKKAQWPSTSFYKFFFLFFTSDVYWRVFFCQNCVEYDTMWEKRQVVLVCRNATNVRKQTRRTLWSWHKRCGSEEWPRESRTWPFPAEFETEQFSIDTSLCGRSEEGLLYNSLPRANPSPASAQNFWLCRRM